MQLTRHRVERAAHTAWVVLALCRVAIHVRAQGWCVGLLRVGEVRFHALGAERVRRPIAFAGLRARVHEYVGHDEWCRAIGVPRSVIERLCQSTGAHADHRVLVLDAVAEAVEAIALDEVWAAEAAEELLEYFIHTRITTKRPPGLPETQGPMNGIPGARFRADPRSRRPRGGSSPDSGTVLHLLHRLSDGRKTTRGTPLNAQRSRRHLGPKPQPAS